MARRNDSSDEEFSDDSLWADVVRDPRYDDVENHEIEGSKDDDSMDRVVEYSIEDIINMPNVVFPEAEEEDSYNSSLDPYPDAYRLTYAALDLRIREQQNEQWTNDALLNWTTKLRRIVLEDPDGYNDPYFSRKVETGLDYRTNLLFAERLNQRWRQIMRVPW